MTVRRFASEESAFEAARNEEQRLAGDGRKITFRIRPYQPADSVDAATGRYCVMIVPVRGLGLPYFLTETESRSWPPVK